MSAIDEEIIVPEDYNDLNILRFFRQHLLVKYLCSSTLRNVFVIIIDFYL
jgi:hypothetical protein